MIKDCQVRKISHSIQQSQLNSLSKKTQTLYLWMQRTQEVLLEAFII